ncbi:hypothetical protein [Acidocella aromatica]|uniref:Uncharacterized protein n=1 Tax=Acidocella aromatica TaxID=1303579 RepID=A0A840VF55_9PROT|nr:hypothetical protein [Acidocella aromatica]MBB5374533.1 hypothetical protein [Acidocella aromatica]
MSDSTRVRITDVSVANIEVATDAKIIPVKGGFNVQVSNQYGAEILKNGGGNAVYKTKGAAKRTVERHNNNIKWHEDKVLPSPSMMPPST